MIIGIDNGLDGGIVALSSIEGVAPIAKFAMPTLSVAYPARKTSKAKQVREVDARGLVAILNSLECLPPAVWVYFEECPERTFGESGQMAMRSMAKSMGMILAVLACKGFKNVRRITPQDWKDSLIGKIPKGESKSYALAKARSLWPDEDWLESERSRIPHDGIVDAALIAEYGRRITYPAMVPNSPDDGLLPWK